MGANFNVDIDADEFHLESLKIKITNIKKALRKRFRDEQIARFGNVHIIYPAFNSNHYRQFINMHLKKLAVEMREQTGLNFEFEQSVHKVVYNEGVYPVQGVRPVYTTINQLIRNNVIKFISRVLISGLNIETLLFGFEGERLICKYIDKNRIVETSELPAELSLNELRKPKLDNLQAIVAVHESGHAIVAYFLLHEIPVVIYSVTTDSDIYGFTYSRSEQKYITHNQVLKKVAAMLGGYVAEEFIFGKEHLTTGSNGDIEKATNFLSEMYMKHGMGDIPLRVSIPVVETAYDYHDYGWVEDKIKLGIVKAMSLAKEILLKEKRLLLVMADYLSNRTSLRKADILKIIDDEKSGISYSPVAINNYDYRQSIKEQLDKIRSGRQLQISSQTSVFLNKDIYD